MKKLSLFLTLLIGICVSSHSYAQFTTNRLVVLRVGDGSAALTNSATAIFLDEYTTAGVAGTTVTIPTSSTGVLTCSGTATSEGLITLSTDATKLVVPGYVANSGTASVASTTSAAANRGIGFANAAGTWSAGPATATNFSGNNLRGAASDGTNYWATGGNTGVCTDGTLNTVVSSTITNIRSIAIYNGQLYYSTGSGTNRGVYSVGTGTPTSAGNTATVFVNGGASASPYQFALNPASTICYIADDRASASGGVQRWDFSGGVWSLTYTLGTGVSNIGARGLTVDWTGTNPVIYGTSAEASANRIFTITDAGGSSTATTLATAGTNKIFRGIAFTPGTVFTTTWNGTIWTNGTPNATSQAIIASSTTPGSFTCKNLTINSGVALTINAGATATINGNLINNGNGISGTGTVSFEASGSISGNAISFSGTLLVGTGATLTTGGLLTLASDATNTGRVGTSLGTVSGNVTVQRYIPGGRRAFRFLAHPFTSALAMSELTDDINITGTGGSPFTTTGTNNPSAYNFDAATGDNSTTGTNPGWTAFTASSTWAQYQGMRVLVRGALGEGLTSGAYTPSAVTIDMTGTAINQGDITMSLTKGPGDFIIVSNPFPSQINMTNTTSRTNVGSAFFVWDANQGTKGGYTSVNYAATNYILPAYASFVTTLSASGSITFPEACKTATTPNALFKTTAIPNTVQLRLEDSTIFWDRLLLTFDDNAMATVDYPDAAKLYNPDMSFYTLSKDDSMLSIDTRPYADNETIKLGLYSTQQKSFKIVATDFDIPAGTKLFLTDKYLNKKEEITAGYEYWFTTTADTNSWGNNRFELNTQGKVITTGISTPTVSKLKVKLVPNPTTNNVTIYYEGAGKELNIVVTNMVGVKVAQITESNTNGSVTIPMQNAAAGMYIVTIKNGNETLTQKLIKQ